jgi:tetratricopeptide (TPR) repeat protein
MQSAHKNLPIDIFNGHSRFYGNDFFVGIYRLSLFILFSFLPLAICLPLSSLAATNTKQSYLKGIASYDPDFSPAFSALAESYIQLYYRNFETDQRLIRQAAALAEKALLVDARSPKAHKAIASVYFAQGKIDEAIEEIERAVDMKPEYARAWLNLGTSQFKLGAKKKAIGFLKEVLKLNNDPFATAIAHFNIACIKAAEKEHRQALHNYSLALKLLPNYFNIHYGLGISFMNLDRDKDAILAFEETIRLKPDYAPGHHGLASALHRLGDIPKAQKSYETALRLNPVLEEAERGLAALNTKKPGCLLIY